MSSGRLMRSGRKRRSGSTTRTTAGRTNRSDTSHPRACFPSNSLLLTGPDNEEAYTTTTGFAVQPRRWVVERTFAWLGRYRRLAKDYERKVQTAEAMIKIAMTRLMLRRLTRA
ncbi:transposase [Longibacter sp.]|uniref:transposase n=1 Tax=Longibacter sp. TaxID=2045415 RepID=UPI003EB9CAEB